MTHMDRGQKGKVGNILKKTRDLPNHSTEDHIDHGRGSGDDSTDGGDVETDSMQRNQTDMSSLPTRLASFKNWPIPLIIPPTSLAMSGFFYTLSSDRVECYSCHGKIEQWEAGDDAVQEHRKHFPRCKLVKNNKPDVDEVDSATGVNNTQYLAMQNNRIGESSKMHTRQQHQSARIVDTNRPVHRLSPLTRTLFPRYCEVSARKETFTDWSHQQPASLAEAGFFALGGPGESKCFYCGGGLRCWGPNDDPWVEHAKWFPKCEWLIRKKGENFISRVQQEFPNTQIPSQTKYNQNQDHVTRNHQKPSNHKQSIQKRTITFDEAMQSKLVKQILEMGFEVNTVGEVVKRRLTPTGDVFSSAANLFDAVMKATEESASNRVDPPPDNTNKDHVNAAYGAVNRERITSSGSSDDDLDQLLPDEVKTTLQNLRDKTTCKICMDDDACVVFIPCGHLVTCMSCCNSLSLCPICRTEIKSNMKAYLA